MTLRLKAKFKRSSFEVHIYFTKNMNHLNYKEEIKSYDLHTAL